MHGFFTNGFSYLRAYRVIYFSNQTHFIFIFRSKKKNKEDFFVVVHVCDANCITHQQFEL